MAPTALDYRAENFVLEVMQKSVLFSDLCLVFVCSVTNVSQKVVFGSDFSFSS